MPSSNRQPTSALVPVPQGERSNAPSGQSTNARPSWPASVGGPSSITWSIVSPPSPVMPRASSARRIDQARAVSAGIAAGSTGRPWSRQMENHRPEVATSPLTSLPSSQLILSPL